jgi:hypothetical protein
MHVNGAVPPVNVAVKVSIWLELAAAGELVKLLIFRGGLENV